MIKVEHSLDTELKIFRIFWYESMGGEGWGWVWDTLKTQSRHTKVDIMTVGVRDAQKIVMMPILPWLRPCLVWQKPKPVSKSYAFVYTILSETEFGFMKPAKEENSLDSRWWTSMAKCQWKIQTISQRRFDLPVHNP